jgi:ABC-type multidrug transport system permease subunit
LRAALLIARHHLRRMVKSPGRVLLMAAVPVTLALVEYAAFGQSVASGKLPPIQVLFIDEDKTFASSAVPQFFAGGPMKDSFTIRTIDDRQEARRLFEKGDASALIVAPKGFQDALLAGTRAELQLYKNPIQTFAPDAVSSVLDMGATLVNGLYGQATGPIRRIRELNESKRTPTEDDIADIARGFFRAGQGFGKVRGVSDLGLVVQRPGGEAATRIGVDPGEFFAVMFPGLVLFGLMFISQVLTLRLLRDRERGLQRRLLTAPASRTAVLAGGMLYVVVGLFALLGLLGLLGAVVFRIHLRDPAGLLTFGLGFAGFAAGLNLAIVAVAVTDRGARAMSSGVITLLSLLGASFIPIESYPPFLRRVAELLPNGAAQRGMVDILVHRRPAAELAPGAAVVWVWAAAALLLAFLVERRKAAA